jgi:hypothetical protein
MKNKIMSVFILSVVFVRGLLAQDLTPIPTATPQAFRVWTIEEILSEPRATPAKQPIEYCNGGRFKPCVCSHDVSRDMRYRPSVKECGGNAAIVLYRKYLGAFSVVVRDKENRDRWPRSGFGGCSTYERDVLGLNKCSAFKVQEKIPVDNGKVKASVNCLGASGYSSLFKGVRRVTLKLSDVPDSNKDPLVRWCLKKPSLPLN